MPDDEPSRAFAQDGVGRAVEYAQALSCRRIHCMAGLRPMMRPLSERPESWARNARFSSFNRVCSMERSIVTRSLSKSSGLVR